MTEPSADPGTTPCVVIDRTIDAPPPIVWQLWTDPHHFSAWYGPTGATVPIAEMDVRVGGRRLICLEMGTPDGVMQMWFTGEYREIDEPRRLVYTEAVSDADGNVLPPDAAGMPDGHPASTEVAVELHDLGERTRIVLTHVGIPADSPGATGWAMALEKLATLAAARASDTAS